MSDNEIDEGYNKCIKEYKSRFEWDNEENLKFTPDKKIFVVAPCKEAIYCTSKTEYRISLTGDALDDPTKLRKNVKRF
ncbi:hypothetical protein RhiirA5_420880 [Rhizophagus irregularis]|uniref:Uncharacterized protein n=1 Tax=Rhizophagus irregularis TaxID=588596 RepID=A0A2N0PF79_9GLOM|nr:hypothetical protein RhiirA5_420880 [Rhizophagus irregularis]